MSLVTGATQYFNASTLSNLKGMSARAPSLLGDAGVSMLDVARGNAVRGGGGISGRARALNAQALNASSQSANGLFSATIGNSGTVEALKTKVMALRSRFTQDQLAPSLRGDVVDTKA